MKNKLKSKSTEKEREYQQEMAEHIRDAINRFGENAVLDNFAKYASRQSITRFLARDLIFREVLHTHGSVIECGVYAGQGVMSWAHLSSIYEPVGGVTREIFGFDTFSGFPSVSAVDQSNSATLEHTEGYLALPDAYVDLLECIRLYDKNRFLSQFPKVHIIKGDFMETSLSFFNDYPHVIPALLYLDFDIYEPTKKALEIFYPRMPKGSVIAFDEANNATWPGETVAIYEMLDVKRLNFRKVGYDIKISYAVIE